MLPEELEAFKAHVREEVSNQVRQELAEQWIEERDALISKLECLIEAEIRRQFPRFT